jgi:uncharacterized protein DUF6894
MRRYFFDVRIGDHLGEDDEGQLLPQLEAVQKEALLILADVAKGLMAVPANLGIEVRDEDGAVMRVKIMFEIDRTN